MGLITVPSKKPDRRIEGSGAASGFVLAPVLVWVFSLFGLNMPAEVAASIGGIVGTAVTYVTRPQS